VKRRGWFRASSTLVLAMLLAAAGTLPAGGATKSPVASADSAKAVRDSTVKAGAAADSAKSDQERIADLERELERLKKKLEETSDLALSGHNRLQVLESPAPADAVSEALAKRPPQPGDGCEQQQPDEERDRRDRQREGGFGIGEDERAHGTRGASRPRACGLLADEFLVDDLDLVADPVARGLRVVEGARVARLHL